MSQAEGQLLWWMYTHWDFVRALERGLQRPLLTSPSILTEVSGYHTGAWHVKTAFLPLPFALSKRFKTQDQRSFFCTNFVSIGGFSFKLATPYAFWPKLTLNSYIQSPFFLFNLMAKITSHGFSLFLFPIIKYSKGAGNGHINLTCWNLGTQCINQPTICYCFKPAQPSSGLDFQCVV